jgi:hypothetical protein
MFIRRFIYSKNNQEYVAYSTGAGIAADAGGIKDPLSFVSKRFVFITRITPPPFHHAHTTGNPVLKKPTDLNHGFASKPSDQTIKF